MAITTLSMVLTVFVLNLHHISDRPVPVWARKVILIYLAKMLGICVKKEKRSGVKSRTPRANILTNHLYRRASVRIDSEGDERSAIIELLPTSTSTRGRNDRDFGSTRETVYLDGNCKPHSKSDYHHHHHDDSGDDAAHDLDYAKDWKRVAEVFDRLFFWLFLLAILISTLVLFHPLTDAYVKRIKHGIQ